MSRHDPWTVERIKAAGAAVGLPTAAEILGISMSNAYGLAQRDAFPVPVLHIGARVIVPTAGLLRLLGVLPDLPTPVQLADAWARLEHPAEPSVHVVATADFAAAGSTQPAGDHPSADPPSEPDRGEP